ncbi:MULTISPECIES: prolyl oligopeptidase family protein [Paraburkholderia]|uniref:Prolyl oligopeptidase family serine peptidase n=1 Tax=Paraburkholderia madseniana TaxID=2599607 RepID=A0AAP5BAV2_9BURK|nr:MULTISPECIES: prolyl oligopeptidase family serine peptidase [Paraburkholderia]MCX4145341.1 prolyl oligopeptidase family serine peptidase [Paraburkholderia madseniana]MDN7148290.1 prolyl oligopeptidase family serine peptidase [Paraburkholderia sp. WS6]MDQ6407170.1 prolyl oligopeptidase family serine peptidase [Paraburkholderia madseniana]
MPASPALFSWPLSSDPFLSLEALDDPDALAWVESQNARTRAAWCSSAEFDSLKQRLADAYLPRERPVVPDRWKEWAYDLWQDERNPKGIWRRTTWAAWRSGAPVWQNLLDFDALGAAEGTPWVCAELDILYPDGDRALVTLSPGGSDALVVREFDIDARRFVDDGFVIAKAGKHTASWIDRDTLYVGWDNGRKTLTRSGYPREVRRWTRGSALTDAPVVFKGAFGDIGVEAHYDPIERRHTVVSSVDFFDSYTYYLDGTDGAADATHAAGVTHAANERNPANAVNAGSVTNSASAWLQYDVPSHVAIGGWQGWLLLEPRLDWDCNGVRYPGGALLAIREAAFLRGERDVVPLFTPTSQTSACEWTHTRNHLIVSYLEDVQSKTLLWTPSQAADQAWQWHQRLFPSRDDVQADVSPIEPTLNDEVFVDTDDYLQPPAYWLTDLAQNDLTDWTLLDRWPTQFDAAPFAVTRGHAVSADGTRVPYTVIGPRVAQQTAQEQTTQTAQQTRDQVYERTHEQTDEQAQEQARPCLLNGYGGFAIPLLPGYLTGPGIGWLERGGVYVVAHIRGGGEFGTQWHTAAQGEHRQRSFDDFIAVAEALISTGVTSAAQLGIQGGSNGGLLVAASMVQRPELFGAVVCEVPLLDMSRYHLLHAGASWIDEYGDPDEPDAARVLAAYSPYHRVSADVAYPPVLFTTSTADDRVHPGHARKMAARMQALGAVKVWYRENTEGGHGGSDELEQAGHDAMVFEFLWRCLNGPA